MQQVLTTSTKNPYRLLVALQVYVVIQLSYSQSFSSSTSDVCKGHSTAQIVLLDTWVAPLCCRVPYITARDVHADHVPKVTLNCSTMVVCCSSGRVSEGLWLDHRHYRAGLLGTAAV